MEYAYMEAPRSMQGLIMGLYYTSVGVGYLIGAALPPLFSFDLSRINLLRLDYYFYGLGVTMILCSILFALITKNCNLNLNRIIAKETRTQLSNATTPVLGRRVQRSRSNNSIE